MFQYLINDLHTHKSYHTSHLIPLISHHCLCYHFAPSISPCSALNMERAHLSLSFSVYSISSNLQTTQVTLFYTLFNSLQGLDLESSLLTFPLRISCVIFFSEFVFSFLSLLGYLHFWRQDSLPAIAHRISNMAQVPQICFGK